MPAAPVNAAEPLHSQAPSIPAPGGTPVSAPVFAFQPLTFVGSPAVAGLVQPHGEKGGEAWPQNEAAPYSRETVAGPGLGAANPRESYYFLDEGLSASSRANPLPYGWNGQALDLGPLPSQHVPELALPPLSGARQFDAHIFRRDFPILHERVNGKPLVWLDNAATTQKPQAVIDRLVVLLRARELQHPPRRARARGARHRRLRGGARQGAPLPQRAVGRGDRLRRAARPRRSTSWRRCWGRRNVGQGDEIVITHLEHHANIVPWQMLVARGRREAARRAGRRSRRRAARRVREAARIRARASSPFTARLECARHRRRPRATWSRWRTATARACWSTAPSPSRTCRSTCRRSTATSTSSPGTRSSARPASARSTARPTCSKPCRHGRAAAT